MGYELFAEEHLPEIRGSRVVRHPTLTGAFDQMAHLSRRAIERLDITLPVGVCFWPGDPQHWPGEDVFASDDLRFSSKKDYSFIPNINASDDARRKRYDQLIAELLTHATDRAAGILQLYFDAVNPPPYVKRVTVTQGGTTRYEARWVDRERVVQGVHDGGVLKYSHPYRHLVVDGRRLVRTRTAPIQSGEPAGIEIEFGPAPPVPGAAGVRMDAESVLVSVHERYVNGVLSEDGRTWRGTVTHTLAGGRTSRTVPIHITARDRGPHLEGEDGGGMYLDGDPGTPARASCPVPGSTPTFLGNESGYDEHHAVTIRDMIDPEIPHVRVGVGIKLRVTENHSKEGTRETLEEVSLEARGHFTKGRFTGIIDTRKGRNRTTGTLTAAVEPTTGEVLTLEVDATMVEAVLAKAGMVVDRSGSTRTVSAKIKNVPYLLCWDRRGPVPPGRHEIFRPGWHSCRIRGKAAEASVVSFASSWQHVPAPGSNQDEPPPGGSVTGWRCEEKSEIVVSLGTH
jgi:hypothetical protein